MHPAKTDYGIDAPGVIRNLFVIGVALFVLARFLPLVTLGSVALCSGRRPCGPVPPACSKAGRSFFTPR